jgi:NSS family neurotransmitter:Na+ symporter
MSPPEESLEKGVAREAWITRMGFIFAVWGSMTGLGNVWNWPYRVSSLGGGPFVIIYIIMLALVGIPVVLTEFVLGSTTRRGFPGALKRINKHGEFFGWFCLANAAVLTAFYCVIIGWAAIYAGFAATGFPLDGPMGPTIFTDQPGFFVNMLFSPILLVGLVIVWIIIFIIDYFGTRGIERAVMLFFPILWAIIIGMAIWAFTLPGAAEGLNFYLNPDPAQFLNSEMWSTAVSLSFFKLSAGMGILTAYASYLPRKGELTNSAITTSLLDTTFAFTAGLAIFPIAAFAGLLLAPPGASTVGFAFIAWPGAMVFPGGNILGVVFFIMMVFLGITSAVSLVEAIVTAVIDKFGWPRSRTVIVVCILIFSMGLPFVNWIEAPGLAGSVDVTWGLFLLDVVDYYVEFYGLVIVALFLMLIMGWVYGGAKIVDDANESGDFKLPSWYQWFIKIISPIGIIIALSFIVYNNFILGTTSVGAGFMPGIYGAGTGYEFLIPGLWVLILLVTAFILYRLKGVD